jgi:hypothetical protein
MHMVSCGAKPSIIEELGVAGGPGGSKSSVSSSSGAGLEQF